MIKNNNIYLGSCLDYLEDLEDNSVDCIILDPFFNEWDKYYNIPINALKENGVLIAFSNRPHTGRLQVELDKRMRFLTEIIWNFSDGRWVSNNLPRICHENILIYTKDKKNPLNDMRLLEWIDKPKQCKKGGASIGKWKTTERVYNPQDYSQVESVIYLPRNVGKEMGIVSKPKELITLLLQMCTKENDVILDCFMGSGTIPIACIATNRQYIGFELDKSTYDKAENRIQEYIKNL